MSSRCKACNEILTEQELVGIKYNGEPEDLCYTCKNWSSDETEQETDLKYSSINNWQYFESDNMDFNSIDELFTEE